MMTVKRKMFLIMNSRHGCYVMIILVVPGERPQPEGGHPLQQPAGGGFGCQEPQQDLLHEELQQLAEERPDWWVS